MVKSATSGAASATVTIGAQHSTTGELAQQRRVILWKMSWELFRVPSTKEQNKHH